MLVGSQCTQHVRRRCAIHRIRCGTISAAQVLPQRSRGDPGTGVGHSATNSRMCASSVNCERNTSSALVTAALPAPWLPHAVTARPRPSRQSGAGRAGAQQSSPICRSLVPVAAGPVRAPRPSRRRNSPALDSARSTNETMPRAVATCSSACAAAKPPYQAATQRRYPPT